MLCSISNGGRAFGIVVAEERGGVIGGQMEDNELEEGEACAFYNDFDPDVALSYIDDKIHDVLGHFQKEFEGGVSAENLGAKYGGYGSFLPTHQRSPSVLIRPRTPVMVQNYGTQNPPNEGTVERMRSAAASSAASSGSAANPTKATSASNHVPTGSAALAVDMINKGDMISNVMKGSKEMSPLKRSSVAKNVSGIDQNKITLRIKVAPDSLQRSKNSAIYSGLGLENSPSSSLEDSPDDRQESSPGDEYTPVESPISIIRIMTSYQIPGGFLLTPLREDMLKLSQRDDRASARDAKNRTIKVEVQEVPATNKSDFELGMDFQGSKEKKGRSDEKQTKHTEVKESDTEIGKNVTNSLKKDLDIENKMGKDLGSSNLNFPIKSSSKDHHHERTEKEVAGDSGKEKIKGSNLSKEVVKGGSKDKIFRSDIPKTECKEVDGNIDFCRVMKSEGRLPPSGKLECKEKDLCQVKEARRGSGHRDFASDIKKLVKETVKDSKNNDFPKDLTGYKEWNEQKDAINEMSKDKVFGKVVTDEMAGLHNENEKEHGSTNKKKQKDMNRKKSSSKDSAKEKFRDFTKTSSKDSRKDKHKHAKDSVSPAMFGESMKARKESKQAPYKDFQRDHMKDVDQEQNGNRKDSIEVYRKDGTKESRLEPFERGSSRFPEREKEREHSLTKLTASKKLDHASTSEAHVPNAVVAPPLPGGLLGTDPGLIPIAPVLIKENWVQCDACEKWRLLPFGVEPSSLPQNWLCRMLNWLPFMNQCDISEDETTQALYAMYGQQPGQGQVDATRGPLGAPTSASALNIKQAEPNHDIKTLKSTNISSNGKKGHVQRSIVSAPGSTNLQNSFSKKSKQSSIKSKSLNDVVQPPLEQVQGSTALSHQTSKGTDALTETHKFKQKEKLRMKQNLSDEVGYDTGEGSTPRLKTKRKREGELDLHKHLKKNKAEDTPGTTGDSVEKFGPNKIISTPVKLSGVKVKKYKDSSSPKRDFKHEMREDVSAIDKTFKDQVQTSLETDSRGTYSGLDTGKNDRSDFSAKKRKMKEWKESQAFQEGLPEQYIKDGGVTVKEEESETEHRREKKVKALKSDGKESSASKADGKHEKKGKVTRILVSSSKDQMASGLEEQSRGSYDKEQEWGQPRVQGAARRVSNGIDTLKRDTGYMQPFFAATSSSSKVSCSLKNLANFQEVRGSPVESVSSSPMRICKVEKPSLTGRNGLGGDDLIDGDASPRRFSDGEGDAQSDRSGPARKIKSSCVEQPGSHESCKAFQSSLLNSGKVDDNHDRDGKLFSDVNFKDKKSYKLGRASIVTDHLVNGNVTERLSERKEKERCQEKIRDRHNSEGCQDRKGSREKIGRDQDREREKNAVHIKGKDRMHDSVSDSLEELYIRGKDGSRRLREGPPESHAYSPYHEVSRGGKELADDKRSNKSDKDRRNDIDWNSKNDSRMKKLGEGRRGNQLKHGLDDSKEVTPSDSQIKQNRDFSSKHQNLGSVPRKDGKANLQKSLQQDISRGGERASNHGLADKNAQSETTPIRDKLQAIPCFVDKPNLQGHGSAAGGVSNKGTRVEGAGTDVFYGEYSKIPRESSKTDNSNGLLSCRLKPPASNGVSGRDPDGTLSSPIRREHGQAAALNCMKEAKDLKHMGDNIKNKGKELESTALYFNAALEFLKGASLLEPCNAENARHGEITQSMTVYTDTAKLCEYCAVTYERNKEMAAAALAYKCMGVAYMRVVISKHSCVSRDRHELQTAFQTAPPGDSPSSSASDVDNLNNHALMDKSSANPGKVAGSPQVAGDHVIVARHRPLYARVLQYTHDAIAAVEAFRKSDCAFVAANGSLDDANYESAGISAVKRVMDFNFHDIDTLLHLVKLALEAIYH